MFSGVKEVISKYLTESRNLRFANALRTEMSHKALGPEPVSTREGVFGEVPYVAVYINGILAGGHKSTNSIQHSYILTNKLPAGSYNCILTADYCDYPNQEHSVGLATIHNQTINAIDLPWTISPYTRRVHFDHVQIQEETFLTGHDTYINFLLSVVGRTFAWKDTLLLLIKREGLK